MSTAILEFIFDPKLLKMIQLQNNIIKEHHYGADDNLRRNLCFSSIFGSTIAEIGSSTFGSKKTIRRSTSLDHHPNLPSTSISQEVYELDPMCLSFLAADL